MATPYRWNLGKTDRPGGQQMITMNDERGRLCCRSTDPTHLCQACKERLRRGRTDNALVANAAAFNALCDIDTDAMAGTDNAAISTQRATETSDPDDHETARLRHEAAATMHDDASDEREGEGATVHSVMASHHRAQAQRHADSRDALLQLNEEGEIDDGTLTRRKGLPKATANDYEDDVDDSSDATQNQNHQPPRRRTTMTTRRPGQATQYLAQLRSQGVGGRALEQIENRLRHQPITHNCSCDGSRRHEEGDALVPPTMNQILGIGGPEPTTNSRMPGRNELVYGGIVEGDEPDDALMTPALNYARLTANVTGRVSGSNAGTGGHAVLGGKGYLTQEARDRENIPGFNVPGFDEYPDGNTGAYPKDGYREIPPLTSGRPRVKPTLGPPESGGNVGSYPSQGTRGDMGSTDSAGDDYEDGRGSRSDRGKSSGGYYPTSGPAAQYDAPMEHVDRGDLERGQVHTAGMSNAIYAADYWRRMTPGGIGEGANGLPQDADGQDYRRSPTQDEDDDRRQFGNQKKRRPTANQREEDLLISPTIDMAEQSRTWSKGGSR